ncbi:hypothetical protein [Petrotoga sp. 9PWA.NaAc.5.4]|uniref:hypothetical protein n=1 Tax=Petrotoga sp. 9PWA.NaAc.5.4 TaxID=1434328 RepID=UPI000CB8A2BC|nr:hypothetical protein [Petrotoga sp. 9PWA.NaAc.5.4]PNR92577.1 hypothetical protein X924_09730 [Petrotoga sp. 9PWA.NaAc.5.4]
MKNTFTSKYFANLPLFDPVEGIMIKEPYGKGNGYWVGAPYVFYDHILNKFFLYYRIRKPKPIRGGEVRIAQSDDGVKFDDILTIKKEQLDSESIERSSFLRCLDGVYRMYISYVDPQTRKWRIDMMEANHPKNFKVENRRKIFTAEDLGIEGIKDPYVFIVGRKYYMIVSYAEALKNPSPDIQEKLHQNGDVYTTGLTKHPTGLATSLDGINWKWEGKILEVSENGWDKYQARINSVIYVPPVFIGFYDGSASEKENYEERCGLCMSFDLKSFESITPNGPILESPYSTHSVRYVDFLEKDDEIWYYYEFVREDDAHELRLAKVKK